MSSDLVKFFIIGRQIFGLCPCCNEIFRLSDANIFLRKKPEADWMDEIDRKHELLSRREEKREEEKEALREKAREKGRKQADRAVKKIDPVFAPRKLNPDDAKVMFHPVDYIVFNGMKKKKLKSVVLLDRKPVSKEHRRLQRSIERTIEEEKYEWQTIRVLDDGGIKVE